MFTCSEILQEFVEAQNFNYKWSFGEIYSRGCCANRQRQNKWIEKPSNREKKRLYMKAYNACQKVKMKRKERYDRTKN